MATFAATKVSEATVDYRREAVWAVLTDPDAIARLTPMVRSITAEGDFWRWQLVAIPVLGQSFALDFTERMTLSPQDSIVFAHEPRGDERAGTDGRYDLRDAGSSTHPATHLRIDLTVTVHLPFPRLAGPAIKATMNGVLAAMGAGFARAIEKELVGRDGSVA